MSGCYDDEGRPTKAYYIGKAYALRAEVALDLGVAANKVDIVHDVVLPIFEAEGNEGILRYFRNEVSVRAGRPAGGLAADLGWPDMEWDKMGGCPQLNAWMMDDVGACSSNASCCSEECPLRTDTEPTGLCVLCATLSAIQ